MAAASAVTASPHLPGMPALGLGLWKAEAGQTGNAVYEAIKLGYRHLDGACDYGNEKEVGAAIKRAIDDGLCTREELWITSKLWNTYHHREHVPLACQRSLDDLGLEYLDLYLIHFPISTVFVPFEKCYPPEWTSEGGNDGTMVLDPVPYRETWEAMEELKASGKVKHIGVCNLTCQSIMDILSYCKVKPEVHQVESHVYLQQQQLVDFCQANGIAMQAFSPFGAKSYLAMGPMFATEADDCFNDPVLKEIAAATGRTVGEICLRWQIQRGVTPLPKSVNPARLLENLSGPFSFELSDTQMAAIAKLDKNRRFNDPGVFAKGWGMPVGYPIYG
jgi:diketogulonate reductase-like aldo/keto reductase